MINIDKIEHIYGKSVIESLSFMQEDVIDNLKYFSSLGFESVDDIFERQVLIFICDHMEFKNKINCLIKKIGINYIDEIESNIGLLDKLL